MYVRIQVELSRCNILSKIEWEIFQVKPHFFLKFPAAVSGLNEVLLAMTNKHNFLRIPTLRRIVKENPSERWVIGWKFAARNIMFLQVFDYSWHVLRIEKRQFWVRKWMLAWLSSVCLGAVSAFHPHYKFSRIGERFIAQSWRSFAPQKPETRRIKGSLVMMNGTAWRGARRGWRFSGTASDRWSFAVFITNYVFYGLCYLPRTTWAFKCWKRSWSCRSDDRPTRSREGRWFLGYLSTQTTSRTADINKCVFLGKQKHGGRGITTTRHR